MQHCFYNIRYISNWAFVASTRIYDILKVNAFGAELTREWHISFYIYQPYAMLYTVKWNWRKQFYSVKYKIPFLNILYIQIKIYLLSILHISLQIQYKWNLKIREDLNHHRYISIVYKNYLQICYYYVLVIHLSAKINCIGQHGHVLSGGSCLQTKRPVRRNVCFIIF